jgi:hypothetical protein
VVGLTPEYVSMLRGRARREGSAGLVRVRGRRPKLSAMQARRARAWRTQGLPDAPNDQLKQRRRPDFRRSEAEAATLHQAASDTRSTRTEIDGDLRKLDRTGTATQANDEEQQQMLDRFGTSTRS